MGSERSYGTYTLVRIAADPVRGEWTNVGVIVFDPAGNRIWSKTNFDRAVARGDCTAAQAEHCARWGEQYLHVDEVHRSLRSEGHMRSYIQVREPLKCLMRENYDDLFELFVLGKRSS